MKLKERAKSIWKNIAKTTKLNKTTLLISSCNVILLMVLTYVLNNQSLFTGENLNHYAWMELVKEKIGTSDQNSREDVLYVNVAYDKQLTVKMDKWGLDTIGNTAITNRQKLLTFLEILDSTKNYKYIFLDVRFEKEFCASEIDSALFAKILSMDKIVVANHESLEIVDTLLEKAAISDFTSTIVSTNFSRYRYLYGHERLSMPLYAYNELEGKTINKHGLLYFSDGSLCHNSLFLNFPIESFEESEELDNMPYYYLGSQLLNIDWLRENRIGDLTELTKEKYIVIGDMTDGDIKDTYSGERPGSVITYYAFLALMKEKHLVSIGLQLFLAIIYFFISLSQFGRTTLIEHIPFVRKSDSKILHFTLSFIGYGFVLFLISIILNIFAGYSISILVPSLYFAIQKNIINFKRINK